jgi:hypothetical protein
MAAHITVRPSGKALGADIEGIDLSRPLDDASFAAILDAWSEHLVLRFRGQRLTDPELERFSARLGPLDKAPTYSKGVRVDVDSDYVTVISNVVIYGKPIGDLGNAEALWRPSAEDDAARTPCAPHSDDEEREADDFLQGAVGCFPAGLRHFCDGHPRRLPARFNARHSEHGFAVFHGFGGFAAKADARLHFGSSAPA